MLKNINTDYVDNAYFIFKLQLEFYGMYGLHVFFFLLLNLKKYSWESNATIEHKWLIYYIFSLRHLVNLICTVYDKHFFKFLTLLLNWLYVHMYTGSVTQEETKTKVKSY